jgi:hypothetical protein
LSTSNARTVPAFAHAFQSAELDLSSSATSARTVAGAGLARYPSIASTSAAFQPPCAPLSAFSPSTSVTTTSRRVAEEAAGVAQTDRLVARVSSALTVSIASASKWPRSRASACPIFGRSLR